MRSTTIEILGSFGTRERSVQETKNTKNKKSQKLPWLVPVPARLHYGQLVVPYFVPTLRNLLAELGFEVWIGDAAEIKTRRAKKQKTDRQDAQLLLKLLLEERFPRIWVPSPENRDLRLLLWHRHRLVQMRTRVLNQLRALAMNENRCWKGKLWSEQVRAELEKLPLAFWACRRDSSSGSVRLASFLFAAPRKDRVRRFRDPVKTRAVSRLVQTGFFLDGYEHCRLS